VTLYSCSSAFSQGTHHKFRVGGNNDKKWARSGWKLDRLGRSLRDLVVDGGSDTALMSARNPAGRLR
jgi:hypothetical protein